MTGCKAHGNLLPTSMGQTRIARVVCPACWGWCNPGETFL